MDNASLIARHQATIIANYGRLPVVLVRGRGSRLWDADGKEYLDLFAGFGGTILGHAHPALVKAVTEQAQTLWAVGNQFYNEPQIRLAEHLKQKAFDGRAFFCHSGAESAEAAIKLARLYQGKRDEKRIKIISFYKGFHGRTIGALSATPGVYQQGFGPMTPGFAYATYNDLASVERELDTTAAAVLMEPIQGEGGINLPTQEFISGVRKLCDERGVLLIFDEVWTGVGRTGRYFGHQHYNVTPDIMTMGKALGGGLPVGGIVAKPHVAAVMVPGTHGCTLGGNPVCAAVAAAVFDTIEKDHLLEHATALGQTVAQRLRNSTKAGSRIKEVRGKGLFIGVELALPDGSGVLTAALAKGLIINVTQKNIVRLCPAMTIERETLEQGLDILEDAIAAV